MNLVPDPNAIPPRPDMPTGWYWISVEIAQHILKHNSNNRALRVASVKRMASMMASRQWETTHQGIALTGRSLSDPGILIDAQHRLHAIITSGCGQWMLVTFNVPLRAQIVIDDHVRRTSKDVMNVMGHKMADDTFAATVARMLLGANFQAKVFKTELVLFAEEHMEAIEFVQANLPRSRRLHSSPLRAAVARAYYHYKEIPRLECFCRAFLKGVSRAPEDDAALVLREFMLMEVVATGGPKMRQKIYHKAEKALREFQLGKSSRLQLPKHPVELYPLPSELDPPQPVPSRYHEWAQDGTSDGKVAENASRS